MRPAARLSVGFGAVASLLVACQILVGVKDEEENPRPSVGVDGGAETSVPPGIDAADPCPHALPPGPPDGGASQPETRHLLVVRSIRMGGYKEPGLERAYDFDRLCTCENRDERGGNSRHTSCKAPNGDRCGTDRPADDAFGRDLGGQNAFDRDDVAFNFIISGVEERDVNLKFRQGLLGFVMTLEGYNESNDDQKVNVGFSLSSGIRQNADAGAVRPVEEACAAVNDAGVIPVWDAGPDAALDTWYTAGVTQGKAGWVRDGYLVVDNAGANYSLPIGSQVLRQESPIFVGKVSRVNGHLEVKGNLVGIVSANSLLNIVGAFVDPDNPTQKLCQADGGTGGTLIATLKNSICTARDLLERSSPDPKIPCDAFAVAVGIDLVEVAEVVPNPCVGIDAAACDLKCP